MAGDKNKTKKKKLPIKKAPDKPENESVVGEKLTEKQEKFCRNFTQNYEFFRNATLSYADAYGFDIDSQRDDDAMFKLKNGKEVPEYALETIKKGKKARAKRISDSSKKTMYNNCSSAGSRLRTNVKIQARCRELLNEFFIDQVIDARIMEVIIGGEDRDSISAAKEYNVLKQRVTKKLDIDLDPELKAWIEKQNKILDA